MRYIRWLLCLVRNHDVEQVLRRGHHRPVAMVDGLLCLEARSALWLREVVAIHAFNGFLLLIKNYNCGPLEESAEGRKIRLMDGWKESWKEGQFKYSDGRNALSLHTGSERLSREQLFVAMVEPGATDAFL